MCADVVGHMMPGGQAVVGGVRMTTQQTGMPPSSMSVQTTQAAMAQLASMAQGRGGPIPTQNMMMMRPGMTHL